MLKAKPNVFRRLETRIKANGLDNVVAVHLAPRYTAFRLGIDDPDYIKMHVARAATSILRSSLRHGERYFAVYGTGWPYYEQGATWRWARLFNSILGKRP